MSKRCIFLVLGIVSFALSSLSAQEKKKNDDWLANSAIREDFQSYMGYEDNLAALYLTVPYDVTVGANQQSRLMDIGILVAAFLPLLFLWSNRVRRVWRIIAGLGLMLYLGLVSWYVVMIKPSGVIVPMSPENLASVQKDVQVKDGFFQAIAPQLFAAGQQWSAPLHDLLEKVSGPTDFVTYPLLILLFAGLSLVFHYRLRHSDKSLRSIIFVMAIYGYLWWLFAGGIIWYGLLFIPFAYLVVTKYMMSSPAPLFGQFGRYLYTALGIIWGGLAMAVFVANINYQSDSGKNLIDFPVELHAMGQMTEDEVVNQYFPGSMEAIRKINEDEDATVIRAGSMLSFFVDRNNERVYSDDLLDLFDLVHTYFDGDREKITKAFRDSGVRYFIVSLKLAASDRTPEKTLQKKFKNFFRFFYNHPDAQLIATDNFVKVQNPQTGKEEFRPGVFGTLYREGTYCIFKLN